MSNHYTPLTKPGTVIMIGKARITVGKYLPDIDCYAVSWSGPGHIAGRRITDKARRATRQTNRFNLSPFDG